jgi:hypothetical protein
VQSQRINEMLKELSEMRISGEANDDELLVMESKLTAASLVRAAYKDAEVYALETKQERINAGLAADRSLISKIEGVQNLLAQQDKSPSTKSPGTNNEKVGSRSHSNPLILKSAK